MRKTFLRKKIKNRTLKKKMKGGMMAEEVRQFLPYRPQLRHPEEMTIENVDEIDKQLQTDLILFAEIDGRFYKLTDDNIENLTIHLGRDDGTEGVIKLVKVDGDFFKKKISVEGIPIAVIDMEDQPLVIVDEFVIENKEIENEANFIIYKTGKKMYVKKFLDDNDRDEYVLIYGLRFEIVNENGEKCFYIDQERITVKETETKMEDNEDGNNGSVSSEGTETNEDGNNGSLSSQGNNSNEDANNGNSQVLAIENDRLYIVGGTREGTDKYTNIDVGFDGNLVPYNGQSIDDDRYLCYIDENDGNQEVLQSKLKIGENNEIMYEYYEYSKLRIVGTGYYYEQQGEQGYLTDRENYRINSDGYRILR